MLPDIQLKRSFTIILINVISGNSAQFQEITILQELREIGGRQEWSLPDKKALIYIKGIHNISALLASE